MQDTRVSLPELPLACRQVCSSLLCPESYQEVLEAAGGRALFLHCVMFNRFTPHGKLFGHFGPYVPCSAKFSLALQNLKVSYQSQVSAVDTSMDSCLEAKDGNCIQWQMVIHGAWKRTVHRNHRTSASPLLNPW